MSLRVSSPTLVGRGAELTSLAHAYEVAERGGAQTVIIEGDAGVGKSRLVSEFLSQARTRGGVVLVGRCADVEGGLPYGPVIEVIRDLLSQRGAKSLPDEARSLGVLLPELRHEPIEASQTALFHGIVRLLGDVETPLVVVLEDVHWSDGSTREIARFLVDRLVDERVVLILTVRTDEPAPPAGLQAWIGELKRNPRVNVVGLKPLDREQVARQIEEITGSAPPPTVTDVVYKRSQGNPFVVEELLAAGIDASPADLPSLGDLFLGRIAGLEEDVREVLRAVAVAARGVSSDELAATVGDLVTSLGPALRTATAAHLLVRDRAGRYSFRHMLLRDLFYEELTSEEQRRYHAAFAAALSESTRHPDAVTLSQIAYHWREAEVEEEAWVASIAAGRAAQESLGYTEALNHFTVAAELGESLGAHDPPADALWEEAASAASSASEWQQSVELLERALGLIDPSTAPERAAHLMELLAWSLTWALGKPDKSLIQEALELVPAAPPTALRARLLRNYGMQLEALGEFDRIAEINREAVEVARHAGDPLEEGKALVQAATTLTSTAPPDPESALRGLDLIRQHGTPDDVFAASVRVGNVLLFVSDLPRLWEVMDEAIALASELHVQRSWAGLYLLASNAIFYLGKWHEADRLDQLFKGTGGSARQDAILRLPSTFVPIGQGKFDDARQTLAAIESFMKQDGSGEDLGGFMWAVLLLNLWAGEIDRAWADVQVALDLLNAHPHEPNAPDLYLLALQIGATRCLAGGEVEGDREIIERCIQGAREWPQNTADPFGSAVLAWSEAEYARAHGRHDSPSWLSIADAWAAIGVPWFEAWTRWRAAEALLLSGAPRTEAAHNLSRARVLAQELGAVPLLAEIEGLARRARLLLPDEEPIAGAENRTLAPLDRFGLTGREREVLRLLAEGKSNPEIAAELFISKKTASKHVSHILEKLGVSRRVEAATLAHSMGIKDD